MLDNWDMVETRFCLIFLMVSAKCCAPPSARSAELALKTFREKRCNRAFHLDQRLSVLCILNPTDLLLLPYFPAHVGPGAAAFERS